MDTDTFGHPMVYLILTTKYNSQILIYLNYILLFLVICVAIADYYLIVRNRKIKLNLYVNLFTNKLFNLTNLKFQFNNKLQSKQKLPI